MESMTLGQALELEHRAIDGGIEAYIASLSGAATANAEPLLSALSGLRRHIYLEEEFLFPPLKAAGLMGPIFVMLREHGQLWRQMDTVEEQLADGADAAAMRNDCTNLLSLLDDHNSKEEPIIYTQADEILGTSASSELLAFLETGTTPEGWVCSAA
ncbi:hemerythrin domain-containing protein [Arthrobacter sp. E3]|uniref:hemerythrin domain-containing protein n=1 Tax=Arthrobacter sp. E3 TaxID=517402 RepID=UPI001A94EC62|nr:hemerythrin domain-containing protein [Arthrobacter sp. E3]